jgi:hypothetical protein
LNEERKYWNRITKENIECAKNGCEDVKETARRNIEHFRGTEDEDFFKERYKKVAEEEKEALKKRTKQIFNERKDIFSGLLNDADKNAKHEKENIKNRPLIGKVVDYSSALWNGKVGLGKGANRAIMIGVPTAAAGGSALAIHKHRKKKKESEENKKESKK